MKRLIYLIHILLSLHLLAAFSQAGFIAEAGCSHCQRELLSSKDCCERNNHSAVEVCQKEGASVGCPHGGFCQGGEASPFLFSKHIPFSDISAPSPQAAADYLVRYNDTPINRSACFISKKKSPPIFVFNCSFLI